MLTTNELDRLAKDYYLSSEIEDHGLENRIQLDSIPRILSYIPHKGKLLELGYGDGLLTAALQASGLDVELLEGSTLLAECAARLHPKLVVHHGMFEHFRPKKTYTTILALHVLEHLDDPVLMLHRLSSWLVPGGRIVIVVPNRNSIHRQLALRMGLISRLDELSARDHLVGHQRVYDFSGLEQDVTRSGLRPVTRFGSFLKTLPNGMMMGYSNELLKALDGISDDLPPEILANIGLVAERP